MNQYIEILRKVNPEFAELYIAEALKFFAQKTLQDNVLENTVLPLEQFKKISFEFLSKVESLPDASEQALSDRQKSFQNELRSDLNIQNTSEEKDSDLESDEGEEIPDALWAQLAEEAMDDINAEDVGK